MESNTTPKTSSQFTDYLDRGDIVRVTASRSKKEIVADEAVTDMNNVTVNLTAYWEWIDEIICDEYEITEGEEKMSFKEWVNEFAANAGSDEGTQDKDILIDSTETTVRFKQWVNEFAANAGGDDDTDTAAATANAFKQWVYEFAASAACDDNAENGGVCNG